MAARPGPFAVGDGSGALVVRMWSLSAPTGCLHPREFAAALSTSRTLCKVLMSGKLPCRSAVVEEDPVASKFACEGVAPAFLGPFSMEDDRPRQAPLGLLRLSL